MLKFQNSKRRCAQHRSVVKWGAFALLAVTAAVVCASFIEVHNIPSFTQAFDFGSIASLAGLPVIGALGLERGMFFMKEHDDAGGGGGSYEGKDDFEKAVLGATQKLQKSLEAIQSKHGGDIDALKASYAEIQGKLIEFQKAQMLFKSRRPISAARGQISIDCARHLGALAYAISLKHGRLSGRSAEIAEAQVKDILGAEWKAAITASDIPLPVEYSGEIVELVSMYGKARLYGTVFPLGAGSVKLPKLTTDPTFGLIAMSATVPEKVPQAAFVTFNAEKFGGLVRLPFEIDDDSIIPMGQFLARYSARNIALVEDYNFFQSTGAGSGQNGTAKGLCQLTIDNSKVVQMATTKTHYSDVTVANMRAVRAVPDEAALMDSAYYCHPTFEQAFSAFNTGGDRPYNPNAQIAGTGSHPLTTGPTLDGWPIRWVNTMPVFSAGVNVSKVFILFGDPSYQYLGLRGGIRFATSSEAGFTTDEILVRALERFTLGLMANGAVAGIETAAS